MRMWMVSPRIMCRKHLLGEHVELHMFVGTMKKRKSLLGYVRNNLVEPILIFERHEEIAEEMRIRGYNHKSPIDKEEVHELLFKYNPVIVFAEVNKTDSAAELVRRCEECRKRDW